jgi:hypothetical protein
MQRHVVLARSRSTGLHPLTTRARCVDFCVDVVDFSRLIFQLKLSDDRLAVTGFEGYSVVRATHPVTRGRWYFEVEFLSQPPQSHIRIGWSQSLGIHSFHIHF